MGLLLLVDLDGVVYRGSEPVPGVAAVLADRAARGDDVVYVTNNSMHYRADYQTRLAAMGAPVSPDTRRLVAPGRRRPTCASTIRGSGASWSSAPAVWNASCATRATTSSRPATAATRMSQESDRRVRRRRQPRCGRRRAGPEPDLRAARGRQRLHPRRGPVHRDQPRPGLSDRARPAPGRGVDRHRRSRPRPGSCRSRSASPPRTCWRPRRMPSVASRPRRS